MEIDGMTACAARLHAGLSRLPPEARAGLDFAAAWVRPRA
jgi:hypothetical protein